MRRWMVKKPFNRLTEGVVGKYNQKKALSSGRSEYHSDRPRFRCICVEGSYSRFFQTLLDFSFFILTVLPFFN